MANPAIFIFDNDDAAKKVKSLVRQYSKRSGQDLEEKSWCHLGSNLYAVLIPMKPGESKMVIENLFSEEVLKTPLSGKTLKLDGQLDDTKHFGKVAFARSIVEKNADHIDFSGFHPLLERVDSCISDFNSKLEMQVKD